MKQTLIGLALCALLAWGVWRQPPATAPIVQHREIFALGTLVQLSFAQSVPPQLMPAVEQALSRFETRWSVHGDGDLARLNQLIEQQGSAELPQSLRPGFVIAQQACRNSGGLFDPGIGALVRLWGFDDEDHFRSAPPAASAIDGLLKARGSLCTLELGPRITPPTPSTQFDFGASAKGRAVDEIVALLRARGVHDAIVNAGGDLKVIGSRPDRPWRIGIRHPRPDAGQEIIASLEVHDGEAVFSSGDYERFFIHENRRYHHILDPRTGLPTDLSQSATVLHRSAELADAAATALFVAGPDDAAQTMQDLGISHYLLIDAQGRQLISPAMAQRIETSE